jgi:hypothetical protein
VLQELHRVCTIEAAVTGRLSDLLYEREEQARRPPEEPGAPAAGDAVAVASPDLSATQAALKQASVRPPRLLPSRDIELEIYSPVLLHSGAGREPGRELCREIGRYLGRRASVASGLGRRACAASGLKG